MPQFAIVSAADFSEPVVLSDSDERHLVQVLRARIGETIGLTNNQGLVADAKIIHLKPLRLAVVNIRAGLPADDITVGVPLIEKKRLEFCIEKLAELNIKSVQLIVSERCQTRTLSESSLKKISAIATESQKQCGRAFPLQILPPQNVLSLHYPEAVVSFGSCRIDDSKNITKMHGRNVVLIGPEGGFSTQEENSLTSRGYQPLHLGNTVLRTETACIVAATVLKLRQITK